ncbi:MAG TPA: hypothetical protein VK688_10110 [Gemmatimonadales bacterium]|nr:hypothetical protein [Gemmatimonadales bacterium]
MAQWGLYCLANDAVLDWTLAFLESLRTHSPGVELVVIPFDQRVDRLAALAPVYEFVLLDNPDLFGSLDRIGRSLHPGSHVGEKMFRKFAAFHGTHDRFLFLDSDIVLLTDLDRLMDQLLASPSDFIYFDTSPDWVYADPAFRRRMRQEFGSKEFAAGAMVSRKGFLGLDDLFAVCAEADRLRKVFPSGVFDQPYWNYMVDRKRARVAAAYEIIPELARGQWAAGPVDRPRNLRAKAPVTRKGKVLPFMHWAGYRCNHKIPNLDLFLHFRVRAERSWIRGLHCRYRFRSGAWRSTPIRWSLRRVWRELVGFGRALLRPDVLQRMTATLTRRRVP